MTWKPRRAISTPSGSPTYPSPTTPHTAVPSSIFVSRVAKESACAAAALLLGAVLRIVTAILRWLWSLVMRVEQRLYEATGGVLLSHDVHRVAGPARRVRRHGADRCDFHAAEFRQHRCQAAHARR